MWQSSLLTTRPILPHQTMRFNWYKNWTRESENKLIKSVVLWDSIKPKTNYLNFWKKNWTFLKNKMKHTSLKKELLKNNLIKLKTFFINISMNEIFIIFLLHHRINLQHANCFKQSWTWSWFSKLQFWKRWFTSCRIIVSSLKKHERKILHQIHKDKYFIFFESSL